MPDEFFANAVQVEYQIRNPLANHSNALSYIGRNSKKFLLKKHFVHVEGYAIEWKIQRRPDVKKRQHSAGAKRGIQPRFVRPGSEHNEFDGFDRDFRQNNKHSN